MWYKAESITEPKLVDTTSSKKWVYVRKNITTKTVIDDFGNEYTIYVFDEQKIPKEDYTIYLGETNNSSRLDDIEEVLAELMGT